MANSGLQLVSLNSLASRSTIETVNNSTHAFWWHMVCHRMSIYICRQNGGHFFSYFYNSISQSVFVKQQTKTKNENNKSGVSMLVQKSSSFTKKRQRRTFLIARLHDQLGQIGQKLFLFLLWLSVWPFSMWTMSKGTSSVH